MRGADAGARGVVWVVWVAWRPWMRPACAGGQGVQIGCRWQRGRGGLNLMYVLVVMGLLQRKTKGGWGALLVIQAFGGSVSITVQWK